MDGGWEGMGRTVGKLHLELEEPAFPDGLVFAGYGALPALEVEGALGSLHGAGDEAEGVVFAPLLAMMPSEK